MAEPGRPSEGGAERAEALEAEGFSDALLPDA
jgi:hypothetical protein